MPLKIIVVGAGIGGLVTSLALRHAGHEVEIFEKSKFATEVGAALMITPNGGRVLSSLGFSFVNARAVKMEAWSTVNGATMEPLASVDMKMAEKAWGFPAYAVHRVSLHSELLRLATSESGSGKPIKIHLASGVQGAAKEGSITLEDGTVHSADLVVAADGLRSVVRDVVVGKKVAPSSTSLSAFRFLIDTEILESDESLSAVLKKKGPGATLLADTKEVASERHIMWYACQDGLVQNFVGIHPKRAENGVEEDIESVRASMLDEFGHFSPEIVEIIKKSEHVKCWPLNSFDPLETWVNDRLVLVGDAAHPMFPLGGQGSNSAIEDGATLGFFLQGTVSPNEIPERLELFQRARKARASRVQILSKVRAGREPEVQEQLREYADPPGSAVPMSMKERTVHDYGFNVFAKCQEILDSK